MDKEKRNMRSIKIAGIAIVAALALSATAAASASAEEFEFSKTGGQLEGKATNTQVLKVGSGGTVECSEAKPSGEVTKLKSTELESSVAYSGCSVAGLGSAEVTLADLTLFEKPTLVSFLNLIHMKAEALGIIKCEFSILPGQSFTGADPVNDPANSGELLVDFDMTGIHTDVVKSNSKSLCGTEGTESTTGEYEGSILYAQSNGTIKVG